MRHVFSTAVGTYHYLWILLRTIPHITQLLRAEILDKLFNFITVAPHHLNHL